MAEARRAMTASRKGCFKRILKLQCAACSVLDPTCAMQVLRGSEICQLTALAMLGSNLELRQEH